MLAPNDDDIAFTFRCDTDAAALKLCDGKETEGRSIAIKADYSGETGAAIC
tara:strand:- start:522 stop:674 length:153 start_codon:yes stop_codon:yes gene_type:complete